jgi:hypothetical protein
VEAEPPVASVGDLDRAAALGLAWIVLGLNQQVCSRRLGPTTPRERRSQIEGCDEGRCLHVPLQ